MAESLPLHNSARYGSIKEDTIYDETVATPFHQSVVQVLKAWKKYVVLFSVPIIFLPLSLLGNGKEGCTAYAIIIIAFFWIFEVFSIAITALFPLFLFPILGILTAKEVSVLYLEDTNILFLSGLIMAVAVEDSNLHKRFALRIILALGTKPERLLLGFMIPTAFISMFISDTATAAMVMPIGEAVISELEKGVSHEEEELDKDDIEKNQWVSSEDSKAQEALLRFQKALLLSITYAALIGGTATLTGTGPNLILAGQIEKLFADGPRLTYFSWSAYAFPQMLLLLLFTWLYLSLVVLRVSACSLCFCPLKSSNRTSTEENLAKKVLERQYKNLGQITFAEKAVLGHFIFLAMAWLFRNPSVFPGWGSAFPNGYVSDGTAGMLVCMSMFAFPSKMPTPFCSRSNGEVMLPPKPLLTWNVVAAKLPWGIIFLLGSGFAIAEACQKSGLSHWIGAKLIFLANLPDVVVLLLSCILVTLFTEITSNTATTTILLPILAAVATRVGIHPWYLMLPATVASSFAFMLPVATPSNAVVFSTGRLRIMDMVTYGAMLEIISLLVLNIYFNLFGTAYYNLKQFPQWAKSPVLNKTGNV